MAKYYIKSTDIKVYPTAFRDIPNSGDTQSYLNTEFNVTNSKYLSEFSNNQSYSYKDGDYMVLSIHGYFFKFEESDLPLVSNLSAYICLQQKDIPTTGTTIYNNYILVADTGSGYTTVLDAEGTNQEFYFYGLVFTDGEIPSASAGTKFYGLQVRDSNGSIIYQPLKLSTSEIRDGANGVKSIDEELHTAKLIANNVETTGNIKSDSNIIGSGLDISGNISGQGLTITGNGKITNNLEVDGNEVVDGDISSKYLTCTNKVTANSVEATTSISSATITATTSFVGNIKGSVKDSSGTTVVDVVNKKLIGSVQGNADSASKLNHNVNINGLVTDLGLTTELKTPKWGYARGFAISNSDGSTPGVTTDVDGSNTNGYVLKLPTTIKVSNLVATTKITEGGTDLADKYLGKNATASNSSKLDGQDPSYYLDYSNFTNTPPLAKDGRLTMNVVLGTTTTTKNFTANQETNETVNIKIPQITLSGDNNILTIVVPE